MSLNLFFMVAKVGLSHRNQQTILTVLPPTVIESCKASNGKTKYQTKIFTKTLNKNLQCRPSKEDNLDLSGNASKETRKNSPINMPSIHHSLDMENANKVGQNYYILINNEVQPTIDELRKIAVERTEWSKFVVACKPRLFSAE